MIPVQTRSGVGFGLLGDRSATRVHLTGNTIQFRHEDTMSFGISGIPNGAGKHLIVSGGGNSVTGLSVKQSSFGVDFNVMAGGTSSVTLRNDWVDGGYVRYGSSLMPVETGAGVFLGSP